MSRFLSFIEAKQKKQTNKKKQVIKVKGGLYYSTRKVGEEGKGAEVGGR
jgi:hypothetical protein